MAEGTVRSCGGSVPLPSPYLSISGGPCLGPGRPTNQGCGRLSNWGARSKDEREDGKGSDDCGRLCRTRGRIEEAPVGGPSAHHRAYRRGALARRPVGERGISCREGRTVTQ